MSAFFIDRPIFAWVIGLVLMLVGGLSKSSSCQLPSIPTIAPPQISITVTYPGASAQKRVNDTVVRPIQQQLSGLDGLEYISSSTQSNGSMEIDLHLQAKARTPTSPRFRSRISFLLPKRRCRPRSPSRAFRVTKATKNFFLVVGFVSTDGSMNGSATSPITSQPTSKPRISRVTGVGDYTLFGSEYAMRIWLDPGQALPLRADRW